MPVGGARQVVTGEGGDQHQEGGARQVEVGNQPIDRLEAVAGPNEQVGLPGARRDGPVGSRRRLQSAHRGSAGGPYGAPALAGVVDPLRRRLADAVPFGLDLVLSRILAFHRAERPRSHVKREASDLYAPVRDGIEDPAREVEAGGRGSHAAHLIGVNRLVPCPVGFVVGSPDVGRQRHVTVALQRHRYREIGDQADDPATGFARVFDLDPQPLPDLDPATRLQLAARPHHGAPTAAFDVERLDQQDLGGGARRLAADQPRREDPGVVEHQHVAGTHQLRQVGEDPVGKAAVGTADHQQTAGIPGR